MVITYEQLKKAKACKSQLDLFKKVFGDKARLTRKNLEKAYKVGLQISWIWLNDFLVFDDKLYCKILNKQPNIDYNAMHMNTICEYYKLK